MAVQNYLTNYVESTKLIPANERSGAEAGWFQKTISINTADDDGSTYVIAKNIGSQCVIPKLEIENDALTSGTVFKVGLYSSRTGAVIGAALLADNLDFSAAHSKLTPLDGLKALTHEQSMQALWRIAGELLNKKRGAYDLVLTATTIGSTTGKVTFRGLITPEG